MVCRSNSAEVRGVIVWPEAHLHQWAEVTVKAKGRVGDMHSQGQSFAARVCIHDYYVTPLCLYKAPVSAGPQAAVKDCTKSI